MCISNKCPGGVDVGGWFKAKAQAALPPLWRCAAAFTPPTPRGAGWDPKRRAGEGRRKLQRRPMENSNYT